jgi:predicted hydrocarbon binding protein
MTRTIDLPAAGMLGLGYEAVASLRDALLRDVGPDAAGYLQQAGYAGGDAVHAAFTNWLAAAGHPAPEALDVAGFARLASEFFTDLGWGRFSFSSGTPVATIDSPDWVEANGMSGMEQPCCHVGTGLLAAFFGRVGDQPLAVMEVECRSTGATQCRFLLGSADTMQEVWERMAAGESYLPGD